MLYVIEVSKQNTGHIIQLDLIMHIAHVYLMSQGTTQIHKYDLWIKIILTMWGDDLSEK